jgi:hypothetical protein
LATDRARRGLGFELPPRGPGRCPQGKRMVGSKIVSDDCPGIAWQPVMMRGQIDRASTLREAIRGRREEIIRQVRIGMA